MKIPIKRAKEVKSSFVWKLGASEEICANKGDITKKERRKLTINPPQNTTKDLTTKGLSLTIQFLPTLLPIVFLHSIKR